VRDVDLPEDVTSLRVGSIDADAVAELFGFLEFSSLQDRFSEAFGAFLTAPLADGDARVLEAGAGRAHHGRRGSGRAQQGEKLGGRRSGRPWRRTGRASPADHR
jgi:hypothetical protein